LHSGACARAVHGHLSRRPRRRRTRDDGRVTDEYGLRAWPLTTDADLVALRDSERELGWLWAEVSHERVPATDPSAWRGRAATALGHRLVELSYFLDE